MRKLSLLLLSLLLAATVASAAELNHYQHEAVGLSLDYDEDWVPINQEQVRQATSETSNTQYKAEDVELALPSIKLTLVRQETVDGKARTTNILLLVISQPGATCADIGSEDFLKANAADYIASWPGARMAPELDIPAPGMFTYTVLIPHDSIELIQHRQFICVDGKLAMLQSTSATPAGEAAVKQVLATVKLKS